MVCTDSGPSPPFLPPLSQDGRRYPVSFSCFLAPEACFTIDSGQRSFVFVSSDCLYSKFKVKVKVKFWWFVASRVVLHVFVSIVNYVDFAVLARSLV